MESGPPRAPSRPRILASTYDLGHRVCTDGWQAAVEWRLSSALDDSVWARVRRRPDGLCRRLADAATEVEDAASAPGRVLGLAAVVALRWGRQARVVQEIVRTVASAAVPKIGGSQTAAVAHSLRIIGIWSCVVRDVPLQSCPCFMALAAGHTEAWISDELARHLTGLRSVPTAGR